MQVSIGTSGYYYKDWAGVFYPEGTKKKDMLSIYAQSFPAVELNFTYYGIPKPSTFENMLAQTPPEFEFVVKANRKMTHGTNAVSPRGHGEHREGREERYNKSKELFSANSAPSAVKQDIFAKYNNAIAPLIESGRLGAVLAQFPWAFKNTPDNRNYLYYFREKLPDVPLVVEFRHNSWQKQEVFDFLKEQKISYCCVDEPVAQPPYQECLRHRDLPDRRALFTAEPAYVRFHSRDAKKWYGGGRYDYLYKEEELREWLPKIKELTRQAKKTYVFFNNCHSAQAVQNARELGKLLEHK
jgi:uncharacterized protein YecE (DUF72 family)